MGDLPEVRLTILSQTASKANSRKLVMFGKRPAFIKSEPARLWVASATRQFPGPLIDPLFTCKVVAFISCIYSSERPDLDEALVLDFLQGRVYVNDRQVREKHIYHGIDKENPRVEIVIRPLLARNLTA